MDDRIELARVTTIAMRQTAQAFVSEGAITQAQCDEFCDTHAVVVANEDWLGWLSKKLGIGRGSNALEVVRFVNAQSGDQQHSKLSIEELTAKMIKAEQAEDFELAEKLRQLINKKKNG